MDAIVTVSKSEWQAFLEDHSRLVQNYELLLTKLETAHTKIAGLQERSEQQTIKSGETLRQIRTALNELCEETEKRLHESE